MSEMNLELLPEECIVHILSCTSPRDACQLSVASTMIRDAAESDVLWEKFLPSDYRDILSRSVFPLEFTAKKDLFLKISQPLLIDGGNKVLITIHLSSNMYLTIPFFHIIMTAFCFHFQSTTSWGQQFSKNY